MVRLNKMILGLAAIALASTVAISAPVWAQSDGNAGETVEQQDSPRSNRGDRGDRVNVIDRAVVKGVIATTLNMTEEELDAAKEAGQSWEEIAEAQGVAFETVLNAAKASMTAQVNEALAAGEITQEQADRMLERIAAMDSLSRNRHGGRGDSDGGTDTEETGTDEGEQSAESLTRGATFSATGADFAATDFVFLPTIVSVQN